MKIVSGPELLKEFNKSVKTSKVARLAIAFWGDGAISGLGLTKQTKIQAVCNLKMGGTNPHEIESLMKIADVRQLDTLHSKIYLLDNFGAVGSSNASANGLALQGPEITNWKETNVIFEQGDIYQQAEKEFEKIFKLSMAISAKDIEKAKENWSNRRHNNIGFDANSIPPETLLQALFRSPEKLVDRRVYVCAWDEHRSNQANKELKKFKETSKLGDNVDAFEDWESIPINSYLVCFYISPKKFVKFDGFWEIPFKRMRFPLGKDSIIEYCLKMTDIYGYKSVGDPKIWTEAILKYQNSKFWDKEDSGEHMEIAEFTKQFLKNTESP